MALLLPTLAGAYVPSTARLGRGRAPSFTRRAVTMRDKSPIDDERRQKSPGIQNNFFDQSTADFKRPHGSRGPSPGMPGPGAPQQPPPGAGGAPGPSGVPYAPPPGGAPAPVAVGPDGSRKMYSVSGETPMPGREREYHEYQLDMANRGDYAPQPPSAANEYYGGAPAGAPAAPPPQYYPPPQAGGAPAAAAPAPAAAAPAPARRRNPAVDDMLQALYQKLEQARLDLLSSTKVEETAPLVGLVKEISEAIANLEQI